MGAFDTNLGALVIGIFFNTFLYGIVIFQYASYYNTKFNDPLWIKITVLVLFCLDTFHSAAVIYMAWVYAIENYANPLSLFHSVWPYPFTVIATAITAYLTQIFMAYRIFRLTKRQVAYYFILVLASTTFILGIICGVKSWLTTTVTELPTLSRFLTPWLCLEVSADFVIFVVLLYSLSKSRTGFEKSDIVINRLIRACLQTGLVSSIFAILSLGFFLGKPDTYFFAMFGIPMSRVYTNTLMDTLLARQALRVMLSGSTTAGEDFDTIHGTEKTNFVQSNDNAIQLHVRREVRTEVHFDDSESLSYGQSPGKRASV